MIELSQAILLGLIEGITEFLPISSTAHLIVSQRLMGIASPSLFFDTVVQLGAVLAVVIYFRKTLFVLARDSVHYIASQMGKKPNITIDDVPKGISILFASLPILVVGFLLRDYIKYAHDSMILISLTSILVGVLLAVAQNQAKFAIERKVKTRALVSMGIFQVLALIPGASRSGTVIAGGLIAKLSFRQALEISFLMSIPSLGVAGLYQLSSVLGNSPSNHELQMTLVATTVSFICALLVIHFLLKVVRKIGFTPFIIYRILFGIFVLFV